MGGMHTPRPLRQRDSDPVSSFYFEISVNLWKSCQEPGFCALPLASLPHTTSWLTARNRRVRKLP